MSGGVLKLATALSDANATLGIFSILANSSKRFMFSDLPLVVKTNNNPQNFE
jgi:hypothetical protein